MRVSSWRVRSRNALRHPRGPDGLLAAGEPGVQLTWMDAKIGDWVVTPRIGKPVEVQVLWLNALRDRRRGGSRGGSGRWNADCGPSGALLERDARAASMTSSTSIMCRGHDDDSLRPNQILAVGGLPVAPPGGGAGPPGGRRRGAAAVDAVGPPVAGSRGAGLRAALRGGRARAGLRVPPGHGMAVARRPVRRGVGAGAWGHARVGARGRASDSCNH